MLNIGPSSQEELLVTSGDTTSNLLLEISLLSEVEHEIVVHSAQVQQLPDQAWAWVPDREDDRLLVEYLRLEGWG